MDWALRTFIEALDGGVGVQAYNQPITQGASLAEVGYMTAVKNIENTVGEYDFLSGSSPNSYLISR
jgi:hypothetical protein